MTLVCSGRGPVAELIGGSVFPVGVESDCREPRLVREEEEDGEEDEVGDEAEELEE